MKAKLVCGYEVIATPTNITRSITPRITLCKLGINERSFLNPDEARELAAALIEMAKAAEYKP